MIIWPHGAKLPASFNFICCRLEERVHLIHVFTGQLLTDTTPNNIKQVTPSAQGIYTTKPLGHGH